MPRLSKGRDAREDDFPHPEPLDQVLTEASDRLIEYILGLIASLFDGLPRGMYALKPRFGKAAEHVHEAGDIGDLNAVRGRGRSLQLRSRPERAGRFYGGYGSHTAR